MPHTSLTLNERVLLFGGSEDSVEHEGHLGLLAAEDEGRQLVDAHHPGTPVRLVGLEHTPTPYYIIGIVSRNVSVATNTQRNVSLGMAGGVEGQRLLGIDYPKHRRYRFRGRTVGITSETYVLLRHTERLLAVQQDAGT